MSDVSAVLTLPYILPAQAQKHVTHNEALARLDVAVQLAVIARDVTDPPSGPAQGDRYLVPAGATGDWAGHEGEVAVYDMSTWVFQAPVAGWVARVLSEDAQIRFDGSAWQEGAGALQVDRLGVNGAADATNRLTSVAAATLLTHDGAGHQLKVNKADESDTASLLFQTGRSGRAEMGTTGSDDFAIKVSADGASWVTALSVDAASGTVSGAAVQSGPADTGPGKLARADYAYGPGNLLGSVTQSGGTPTGAVLESGSNANGAYTRYADGTQICTATLSKTADEIGVAFHGGRRNSGQTWVYPAGFTAPPTVSAIPRTVQSFGVVLNNVGTNACSVFHTSVISLPARDLTAGVIAIGRWF